MIAAAQAIDLIGGQNKCSPKNQALMQWIRTRIPFLQEDSVSAYELINIGIEMIKSGELLDNPEK